MDDKEKSFLGKGWSFPPAFDKKLGSVEMVSMEEDIRQSLEIYFQSLFYPENQIFQLFESFPISS